MEIAKKYPKRIWRLMEVRQLSTRTEMPKLRIPFLIFKY